MSARPTPRVCVWCGDKLIELSFDTCRSHRNVERDAKKPPKDRDALVGYKEVRDSRGIVRWLPAVDEPLAADRACRSCPAKAWEYCTLPDGSQSSKVHDGRVIPRCCPCGSALRSKSASYCKRCSTRRARAQKRDYRRAAREAARGDAA